MKLNLGCGDDILAGYVNIDAFNPKADLQCDIRKLPYEDDSIDEIFACHVIEHFNFFEAFEVLKEWKRVLKPGGILRIETPDFEKSCQAFLTADQNFRMRLYYHFFSTPWIDGQWHKFLYTESQLRWTLEQTGFRNIETFPPSRYTDAPNLGMSAIK